MDIPITILLLFILIMGIVAYIGYHYYTVISTPSTPPVSFILPAGQEVYRIDNVYIIPLHASKMEGSPPIGICKIELTYTDSDGNIYSASVSLATGPETYQTEATFPGGRIQISNPVIFENTDIRLAIGMYSWEYVPRSIIIYMCVYGEDPVPRWQQTLLIPDVVIKP